MVPKTIFSEFDELIEKAKLPKINPEIIKVREIMIKLFKYEFKSIFATRKTELIAKKIGAIENTRNLMYFKKIPLIYDSKHVVLLTYLLVWSR